MADNDIQYGDNAFFRDTQLPARLFIFDARVTVFIFAVLFRPSWFTIILGITVLGLLMWIDRKGMTVENAVRKIRCWMTGPYRTARGQDYVRNAIDFKWENMLPSERFEGEDADRDADRNMKRTEK